MSILRLTKVGSTPRNVSLIISAPRVLGNADDPIDHSNDFCRVCGQRVKLYVPSPREIVLPV